MLELQEAAVQDAEPSSPQEGPAHAEEGPATAADGHVNAAPPLNALQQQWAPEPEDEVEEEEEEENVGQWSPVPLDAQHIGTQDVVHEDDDQRLIDLLRKQVRLSITQARSLLHPTMPCCYMCCNQTPGTLSNLLD